jgi:hypothetical protein
MKTKRRMLRMFWKRVKLMWAKTISTRDRRIKRPHNVSAEEKRALEIWSRVVHQPDSVLLYDPKTYECYAELVDPEHPLYLFLESGRIRIINTVIGYDVTLTGVSETWCTQEFYREIHKRRARFKADALGRVVHSLDILCEVMTKKGRDL